MLQLHLPAPHLQLAPAAILAAALLAGCASSPSATGPQGGAASRGAAPPAPRDTAPLTAPSSSSSPSNAVPKAATPPGGPTAAPADYPYPMDAGGSVVSASLEVSPAAVSGSGGFDLSVTIPVRGWLPGQEVFVYLGSRYLATLPGPGSTRDVTVPSTRAGSLAVSGFQFPGNSPGAPIDAYGTATVQVVG